MVARAAGVAQSTVSLVANNSPKVALETRRCVIETARKLGYELLPRNKKLVIGIIISHTHPIKSWQQMVLSSLKKEICDRQFRMEIICSNDIPLLHDRLVSGAISITSDPMQNIHWKELKNIPLVRLNGYSSHLDNIFKVATDTASDFAKLYGSLHDAGHRRIGLFLDKTPSGEQQEGLGVCASFCKQFNSHNPAESPEDFISYHSQEKSIRQRVEELLEKNITGLIVIPGDTALAVSRALNDLGKRIPEDISLVTLEYAGVCENWSPPLTTLARNYPVSCTEALNIIENWLAHRSVGDVLIPGELIPRDSVGAPPVLPPPTEIV